MKDTLKPGLTHTFRYRVPASKMVPALYPESPEFLVMPAVFATGFMVGLIEWACIDFLREHLDWPEEQSVGTHVDVSHLAATPAGLEVTVRTLLVGVEGRKLVFEVEAHDGVDAISRGRHGRMLIRADRFNERVRA